MKSIEIIHDDFHIHIPQLRDLLKCSAVVTSFKDEVKICQLILHKWNVIIEIVETLKCLYKATIAMQKENYKLSEFYVS